MDASDDRSASSLESAEVTQHEIVDPVAQSAYVHRFESELARLKLSLATADDLVHAAATAQFVLLGEYHPLPGACQTAITLLDALGRQGRQVALAVEMVHARDQAILDDLLSGRCSETQFKTRMRYREEWGYPWAPVRDLLRAARQRQVSVFGLDIPPRGGVDDLPLRDAVAAERLGVLHRRRPQAVVIAIFGEAHLAAEHLPRLLDPRATTLRVFHDIDTGQKRAPRGVYQQGAGLFIWQRSAAHSRRRALARVYRAWSRHSLPAEPVDVALLFHEMIDHAARLLGIDPRRERLSEACWLADRYPEVLTLFGSTRSARWKAALPDAGRRVAAERAVQAGAWCYLANENLALTSRPVLRAAAREAGRFIAHWLTIGRLGSPRSIQVALAHEILATAIASLVEPALLRLAPRTVVQPWLSQSSSPTTVERQAQQVLATFDEAGTPSTLSRRMLADPIVLRLLGTTMALRWRRGGADARAVARVLREPSVFWSEVRVDRYRRR